MHQASTHVKDRPLHRSLRHDTAPTLHDFYCHFRSVHTRSGHIQIRLKGFFHLDTIQRCFFADGMERTPDVRHAINVLASFWHNKQTVRHIRSGTESTRRDWEPHTLSLFCRVVFHPYFLKRLTTEEHIQSELGKILRKHDKLQGLGIIKRIVV